MRVRLLNLLERVRSSLWFFPSCLSIAAAILAALSAQLDALVAASEKTWLQAFLYQGDLQGARTLLGTVASSMITVAGVTFSITIVALSLASSQFGPRLLSNFMRDRGNQLVLGTFISTFLFCLLALGHGRDPSQQAVPPTVTATVAVLLAVVSLAVLIYFIHHVASSIRAEYVVDTVARDLDLAMQRLLAKAEDKAEKDDAREKADRYGDAQGATVDACVDGFVQAIDGDGLLRVAEAEDLVVRSLRRAGHFVVSGQPLVMVIGAGEIDDGVAARIRRCFIIGRRRTGEQDPEYGVHQLVEVALRALSPGINDPYTAMTCIDWLSAVLCKIGPHDLRAADRWDKNGKLRVYGDAITFAGILDAAFDQIRQNAQPHPSVSIRLLEALATIAARIDRPARRRSVRCQADMTYAGAMAQEPQEKDREDLEARYRRVVELLES